jgi:hypothetical protein
MKHESRFGSKARTCIWIAMMVLTLTLTGVPSYGDGQDPGSAAGTAGPAPSDDGSGKDQEAPLSEIAAKLANPVSDIWALFTEFDLYFSDGNLNRGSAKAGGRMTFEPIMPLTLYGKGEKAWKLITRPTIPLIFSQPVPTGFDEFNQRGGAGGYPVAHAGFPACKKLDYGVGALLAAADGYR